MASGTDTDPWEGEGETEDTEDTGEESSGSEGDTQPTGDAKRIADLMSEKDKETARANKAEKALAAMRGETGSGGSNDPATKALMTELREASLDSVYAAYPDLAEYGIERSLIEGTTRAEMRESATALVALIKNVSTKARNKALAEAGIKPEPSGSQRTKKSVESMSDEEFLKMLDSVR